jgi:hypothetical membrane protein
VPAPLTGRRLLALGGIVGPVVFVSAWIGSGLATDGYSAVSDAISDLARVGAPTWAAMSIGFVVFGTAVPLYGLALRLVMPGPAWIAVVICGVSTLGVAAVPLGRGADGVHGLFATIGYVSIAAAPALAVGAFRRSGQTGWATFSMAVAALAAACLLATVAGPAHGFFQRSGLAAGDLWIVATAVVIVARGRLLAPVDVSDPTAVGS